MGVFRGFWSALHDVDGQAAAGGLLVLGEHVLAGLAHRLDDGVEADGVPALAPQGHAGGVDGLDRGHRVALDAGDLDESAHRVAGEPQVVLHGDLGGVLDLGGRPAQGLGQAGGGHRGGRADLPLAAHLGPRDRCIGLDEPAHGRGGQQEAAGARPPPTRKPSAWRPSSCRGQSPP